MTGAKAKAAAAGDGLGFRHEPVAEDGPRVRRLTAATGFFRPEEVAIAVELVEERLAKGAASGYEFVFADDREGAGDGGPAGRPEERELAGYACFGPIPLTESSYDLYWIAVAPQRQGEGLGRRLLAAAEERVRAAGGRRIYLDTSTRPQYAPTRAFYLACGYRLAAELADFYAPGDGKAIFVKVL